MQMSMRSDDSGLGVSDNGQVSTERQHHSGGETHHRPPIKTKDKVQITQTRNKLVTILLQGSRQGSFLKSVRLFIIISQN